MQTSCCLVSALLLALVLARNAQNVDFSFNSNFATRMLLDGNCTVAEDGLLRLSVNSSDPNLGSARGLASRAVYAEPVQLYDETTGAAASFNTSFVFGMKAVPGNFMGDGMAFLIAPTRSVPRQSGGGSLGLYDTNVYHSGDPQIQVVAVEWDTFNDTSQDIDSNHVGLDINSVVSVRARGLSEFGFQLTASQNLQRFQVWIEYDAGLEQILVYMADWRPEASIAKSDAALVLTYPGFNLSSVVRDRSYVGFTATTGFYIQENYIYSWSFSSRGLSPAAAQTPLPVPEAVPPLAAKKSGSSNIGLVAGIVSGVVAFLVVVAGVVVWCCCFKTGRNERSSMEPALLLATGPSPARGWKASGDGSGGGNPIPSGGSSSSQKKGFSSSGASSGSSWTDLYSPRVSYGPRPYSYQELKDAAGGFTKADVLGRGGFGHVYKGVIRNADGSEMTVAIKKIAQNSNQGEREFRAEVLSIGRLRHKNLVHLLGWCHEDGELLLVYEFMTNSSLDRHLYSPQVQLPWDQRLRIVQGVAAALVYIHTEAPEKCILHRDLKPSNVMLDSRMTARLGDFGLARIVEDTTFTTGVSLTHLAGTTGYMAPELAMAAKATTKSDIFSFGVLALEVASGRKPYLPIHEDQPDVRLLDWVWQMHEAGKLLEVGDPALEGNLDKGQLQRVLHVGLLCTHPDPGLRPQTKRMQQMLQEDVALPQLPPSRPVAFYN